MTLLNQIGDREAIVTKANRKGDDEPHMGLGKLVHGFDIGVPPPAQSQRLFFFAPEIRRGHGCGEEMLADLCYLRHPLTSIA